MFLFQDPDDLVSAMGTKIRPGDREEIERLVADGLPPIVSVQALSVMLGINPGLVWSIINRPRRYYRHFNIPKGKGVRQISAPRVALKIIQKWISIHLSERFDVPGNVYGFVPGRSHVQAALEHSGANWAYSADIADFFTSTPQSVVLDAFRHIGYGPEAALLCSKLTCIGGRLAQGAPSSPVLSNICFRNFDTQLRLLSEKYGCCVTRYADDIVFSGKETFPPDLPAELKARFAASPWTLAPHKELIQPLKGRIKVHGLLVSGENVRLTKGYRNQVRAYSHILATRKIVNDRAKIVGHVQYARHVSKLAGSENGVSGGRYLVNADSIQKELDSEGLFGSFHFLRDLWRTLTGRAQ